MRCLGRLAATATRVTDLICDANATKCDAQTDHAADLTTLYIILADTRSLSSKKEMRMKYVLATECGKQHDVDECLPLVAFNNLSSQQSLVNN